MKSLQNQYNLIKEGKGNKEIFLKEAKAQFPQYISNVQTFDQVIHSLTEKGILSETLMFAGLAQPKTPDWFKVFNENIKAELKETDETVEEMETKGYNYKEKNNNNISTAEILTGYYAEMKDPKNVEKTESEIKAIVFKNLEKDPLHYVKDGQFGIKGLGYTEEHPGLGPTKEVTGKYKSSGMEPVKLNESKHSDEADLKIYKSELNMLNKIGAKGEKHEKRKADLKKKIADLEKKMTDSSLEENTDVLSEAKKRAIEKHIKEIEKMGEVAAWDHRITKVQEKIEELMNEMTMTEGDEVSKYVDKKAVKELKKDIALLEKKKALYEKQKAKAAKRVTDKSAMQSAAGKDAVVMEEEEEKPFVPPHDPIRDRIKASMVRDTKPVKKESWSGMVRELINKKNLKVK